MKLKNRLLTKQIAHDGLVKKDVEKAGHLHKVQQLERMLLLVHLHVIQNTEK